MSLRSQLLLVSLLLLSLPWAGCQYLREMESTLREGQGMATAATARALASALRERSDLLYPAPDRLVAGHTDGDWYLPAAKRPLISDGYDDDWRDQSQLLPVSDTPPSLQLRAATRGERLFLFLAVTDTTPQYSTPGRGPGPGGDRLRLHCRDARDVSTHYVIATEGPGLVGARRVDGAADRLADRVRGSWRERVGGYTLELQMPLDGRCQGLSLQVIDAGPEGEQLLYDSRSGHGGAVPWLVFQVAALDRWLTSFQEPGRRITVRDRFGWLVGEQEDLEATAAPGNDQVFWLLRVLFRAALRGTDLTSEGEPKSPKDNSASSWQPVSVGDSDAMLLGASAPVANVHGDLGTVTVYETTERYLALTDSASARVFAISALLLAAAFAGLLGYASLLSFRITRLGKAARAIAAQQSRPEDFPRSRAADEIGELSRSYADLLRQIGEYNHYLRGLARTLSHELRTPIAVISSSLENLSEPGTSDDMRGAYLHRARDGLSRLTRIVAAMSEASRIEESLQGTAMTPLPVNALIGALCDAYSDSYPGHHFALQLPDEVATVSGNDDLLAQAMDKLVDNATSFAAAGSTVTLQVTAAEGEVCIAVRNPGPLLPESIRERLFEPMVSLREGAGDSAEKGSGANDTHLGLGLHIARAIAECHGGRLEARDLPDGTGVEFSLYLPAL